MSFTSLHFFAWLAGAALLFHALPPRWRPACLLVLSYAFYFTWQPAYAGLLLGTTLWAYGVPRLFERTGSEAGRRAVLLAGMVPIVASLAFFKSARHFSNILLPLGISYYTFKLIAYLLETYWEREKVETNLLHFALFPAFAPQILSGPIQRPKAFFTQLAQVARSPADPPRIEAGLRLILGGLMLKLIVGDRLGAFINVVDAAPTTYRWPIVVALTLCYTLQLYADFAGYTNLAIGIGKLFGIDAPPNFAAPFAATNIAEMWRRWHMSLTTWVTNYLFMPLQVALRNLGQTGLVLSLTASMVVIGLWHGLTWNFLAFGLCHAVFVSVVALTAASRKRFFLNHRALRVPAAGAGCVLTFGLMTFSQFFWHTDSLRSARTHFYLVSHLRRPGALGWSDLPSDIVDPLWLCMAAALYVGAGMPGIAFLRRPVDRFVPNWVQYGIALLVLSTLTNSEGTQFVYGKF